MVRGLLRYVVKLSVVGKAGRCAPTFGDLATRPRSHTPGPLSLPAARTRVVASPGPPSGGLASLAGQGLPSDEHLPGYTSGFVDNGLHVEYATRAGYQVVRSGTGRQECPKSRNLKANQGVITACGLCCWLGLCWLSWRSHVTVQLYYIIRLFTSLLTTRVLRRHIKFEHRQVRRQGLPS